MELGPKKPQAKLLGLPWDKSKDTLSVETSPKEAMTKREVLSELAKVYDTLGLVSPTTLVAKQLYREMCEAKLSWGEKLAERVKRNWDEWQDAMGEKFTIQRSLAPYFEQLTAVILHGLGDASKLGASAVVYAVVEQESGTTQGFVCAKSRLAKQNLTKPRLELVAAHMATNLVANVERALDIVNVSSVHC